MCNYYERKRTAHCAHCAASATETFAHSGIPWQGGRCPLVRLPHARIQPFYVVWIIVFHCFPLISINLACNLLYESSFSRVISHHLVIIIIALLSLSSSHLKEKEFSPFPNSPPFVTRLLLGTLLSSSFWSFSSFLSGVFHNCATAEVITVSRK